MASYSSFTCSGDNVRTYYGVHIPSIPSLTSPVHSPYPTGPGGDCGSGSSDVINDVFDTLPDAIEAIKKIGDKDLQRSARFKAFVSRDAARRFSSCGDSDSLLSPSSHSISSPATDTPPCPFPSLNKPQMSQFKRFIEAGDLENVRQAIERNPRYLVDINGHTPAIVHEGCRYNALHISSKSGSTTVASHILSQISDPSCRMFALVYPENSQSVNESHRTRLVDHYLNTPDKGLYETPLHFAAKNGFVQMVALFTSYEACLKNVVNKYKETPSQIACSRSKLSPPEFDRVKRQIVQYLEQGSVTYYVPLYRAADYSNSAVLCSPTSRYPDLSLSLDCSPDTVRSTPTRVRSRLLLSAVAGPFESERAATRFHDDWQHEKSRQNHVTCADLHKGLERLGRRLASEKSVQWAESWPFANKLIDLREESGLSLLSNRLCGRGLQPSTPLRVRNGNDGAEKVRPDPVKLRLDFGADEDVENMEQGEVFHDCLSGPSDMSLLADQLAAFSLADWSTSEIDENDSFETPPTSPEPRFLAGDLPSKIDLDAFRAVDDVMQSSTTKNRFPAVAAWHRAIAATSREERNDWPGLESPRARHFKKRVF